MEIGQIKSLDGEPRFPMLNTLMAGLLSIPCSTLAGRYANTHFGEIENMKVN